ncbi:cytochrome c biogenesis protein CcmA [Yersinia frederiksenii]|nr:cytochrome c biogenesis protein CcmA [Yersinia frederiksenii]
MNIEISIKNVQHINNLNVCIELEKLNIICIVSKNGAGKTTLIKALRNLQYADTFAKTSSRFIFNDKSEIKIKIFGDEYIYKYNSKLSLIDTKQIIKDNVKDGLFTELPIPFGDRFNHFQTLSNSDNLLREALARNNYTSPYELISFLQEIYENQNYNNLKVTKIAKKDIYFILKDDGYYIREDYLSSGEFFVLSLYKMINGDKKLIIIDEIDISLDSSAQVKLVRFLTELCQKNEKKIIFTTHSLALIKTLDVNSILYLENTNGTTTISNKSYNYIKSTMFGFKGYDKYILTEDIELRDYLEYIISKMDDVFYNYKIIYIGGSDNTIDLMLRNDKEHIFSTTENVITVLDGDQSDKLKKEWSHDKYKEIRKSIFTIPFESIEKDIYKLYMESPSEFPLLTKYNGAKIVYKGLRYHMSKQQIYKIIEDKCPNEVFEFSTLIEKFLSKH